MSREPVVPLGILVFGWGEALHRFRTASGYAAGSLEPDPRRAYLALFEGLNWSVAIDDRLRSDRGIDWWKETSGGEVQRAIRFARNRVHHDWAQAFDEILTESNSVITDQRYEYMDVGRRRPWIWIGLPEPTHPKYADLLGRSLFEDHLLGKSIDDTFMRLHALYGLLTDHHLG